MRLLSQMLALGPSDRISAAAAQASCAFDFGLLRPMRTATGATILHGARGPFGIQTGNLQPDVLDWLRDDDEWKNWNQDRRYGDMSKKRKRAAKNAPDESFVKIEIGGYVADKEMGTSINNVEAKKPVPFPRLRAWIIALRRVNADCLHAVEVQLRRALLSMLAEQLGSNGSEILTKSIHKWFAHYGVVQLMKMGARFDPRHFDGGASLLHLGLTLWGHRRLVLELVAPPDGTAAAAEPASEATAEAAEAEEEKPAETVTHVKQEAGSVYLASLCAAAHYVEQFDQKDEKLLAHGGCGDLQVAVMVRTSLFGAAMGRTGGSKPGPAMVFDAAQAIVTKALARSTFVLPPLHLCLEAMAEEVD